MIVRPPYESSSGVRCPINDYYEYYFITILLLLIIIVIHNSDQVMSGFAISCQPPRPATAKTAMTAAAAAAAIVLTQLITLSITLMLYC